MEKSKALHTSKSKENSAPPNQLTTSTNGTFLGEKHKRRERPTKSKPKTIKKIIIGSYILIVIAVQLLSHV